ncbi:MAG: hypothetical protein QXY45_00970 [Candidatus Aenigmatarchaeota archaeon]
MKGSTVLSENILTAMSVIISFILMIIVVQIVLSQQSERTYRALFDSIAREIAMIIDRCASTPGNLKVEYKIQEGVHANITIDYKYVFVNYGERISRKPYSGLTYSPGVNNFRIYEFIEPKVLCFVKDDNQITIFNRPCDQVSV